VFKLVLKCIFDDNEPDKNVRITRAVNAVKQAVDDLLNNKVPFEKLILSKLLKGSYKVRDQTKANSFNGTNIFVNDLIKWKHPDYGMCTGVVRKKREYNNANDNFFTKNSKSKEQMRAEAQQHATLKDLDVYLKETETKTVPEDPEDMLFHLSYSEIKSKCGYEITLEKIMDTKTTEKELEKVTQPHARLARRMYKRDPGSAPTRGSRLQFMFVQSKNPNAKQHEKSEHPEYVKEHNLKPDPIYYLEHQLKAPRLQLFELLMKDPESLFRDNMRSYRLSQLNQRDITSFFVKKK
jgi:DNA polymerase elongation subunit (family B)